jgi:hypothetical protein
VEYNMANWGLNQWLEGMEPTISDETRRSNGMKSKDFGRYGEPLVWKYTHDPSVLHHGCVKVLYKGHLSGKASDVEAEWLPIETTEKNGLRANVTDKEGVIFIPHPPDLRKGPELEEWEQNKNEGAGGAYKTIQSVLDKSEKWQLPPHAALDWNFQEKLLDERTRAGMQPNMPHTVELTGSAETAAYLADGAKAACTYDGTPRPFLPVLKALCEDRFPRPYITWRIWEDEAPSSFPLHPKADENGAVEEETQLADDTDEGNQTGLRDYRLANGVQHLGNRKPDSRRETQDALGEKWAMEQNKRVSEPKKCGLYLIQLEEAEGEFHLGLARVKEVAGDEVTVYWYERTGKNPSWGSFGCQFKQYKVRGGAWAFDNVTPMSILLEVLDGDMTPTGQRHSLERPCLNKEFMDRVRCFVSLHDNEDNVLRQAVDNGEEGEEGDESETPKGRPEPKARPTTSSRVDRDRAVAPTTGGGVVAASREATARLAAADAERVQAKANKLAASAAVKAQQASKAADLEAVRAAAAASVAAWAASETSGTAQATGRCLVVSAKPPASAMSAATDPPATAAAAREVGSKSVTPPPGDAHPPNKRTRQPVRRLGDGLA